MAETEEADLGFCFITNPPILIFLTERARLYFEAPEDFVGMFPCMAANDLIEKMNEDFPSLICRSMELSELAEYDFPLNVGAIVSSRLYDEAEDATIPVH